MLLLLLVLQVLLPLAVVGWWVVSPARDRLDLVLHAAAILLLITALLLTGLWTVLPWWLPWLYAALAVVGTVRLTRVRSMRRLPGRSGWLRTGVLAGVALLGGWFAAQGTAGRRMPAGPSVALSWPLGPGAVLVANGGGNLFVSSHAETLDLSEPRHRRWTGQSYGVDLVGLNALGRSASGLQPADPARYAIWNRAVLAPCYGRVVAARDGAPDNAVPSMPRDADPGNHVLLRCAEADVLLAHFRRGTLRVRAGEQAWAGQQLGNVGNSGASSEPHLHLHAQTLGTDALLFSGRPLPVLLEGRWPRRNDRFAG